VALILRGAHSRATGSSARRRRRDDGWPIPS
jgi:hypothetical protein